MTWDVFIIIVLWLGIPFAAMFYLIKKNWQKLKVSPREVKLPIKVFLVTVADAFVVLFLILIINSGQEMLTAGYFVIGGFLYSFVMALIAFAVRKCFMRGELMKREK